jgi:thioredoxin-like negative regulator of GroEL
MTSMLLATIVQTAIMATGVEAKAVSIESYAEAHRSTTETGKPLVVMVSTDWCAPCQTMKRTILPRVREHGLLRKVSFATVNPDNDGELAEKLTGGGPIPQLVMYRKTANGWTRKKLVGGQSVEAVEEFIKEGLTPDKVEKKSKASGKDAPPSEPATTTARHDGAADGDDATQHG